MAFFGNRNPNSATVNDPYAKYNKSIANLLLVVVFSAVNIVMLATNSGSYFLFSAIIPYYVVDYGMFWTGMYPAESYAEFPEIELMDSSFFAFTIVIAVVMVLAYLVCWLIARKKKVGALIFALVFFLIDTVGMFYIYGFSSDLIMDIVFHVWVLVSLTIGVVTYFKVKKAQVENPQLDEVNENQVATDGASLNSTGISDPYATSNTSNYQNTDIEG